MRSLLAPLAAIVLPAAAHAAAPSATGTATEHYNAGRIGTSAYIAYGQEYGYLDPFTLWRAEDGSWSDVNPDGDAGGGAGGGSTPTGSWTTRPSLAGMEVHLYTPATTTANGERALMVALHGCAQSNEVVRDNWSWQDEADEYGMVIAAPMAPGGGVIAGCWDYYGANHGRVRPGRHDDNLIDLAQALLADDALSIDPGQVYVSGLSSGGGQTFVMGCVAPEIFAGIGINAGPAVGTSSSQIGSVATTAGQAAGVCQSFANDGNAGAFDTQLTSVVHGTADYIVAPGYADVAAQAMADIYRVGRDGGTTAIPGGGTETTWSDSRGVRVQKIIVDGLDHAWPAGPDSSGGAYTNHTSVDYPAVLTAFLFENNRRADLTGTDDPPDTDDRTPPAVPSGLAVTGTTAGSVSVSWAGVGDADLAGYEVYLDGAPALSTEATSATVTGLAPGTRYGVAVSAVDAAGNESARSGVVSATTDEGGGGDTPPVFACTATTASNYAHVGAGRADRCGGFGAYACAKGSGERMGAWNVFYRSTLAETAAGYYEVGSCPD